MALLVYITCANMAEARLISAALLDERLAACINIAESPVLSMYTWQEVREESQEILLLAKTMEDRFEALRLRVRALHSYETPCIIALPLAAGDPDYLSWIFASTRAVRQA